MSTAKANLMSSIVGDHIRITVGELLELFENGDIVNSSRNREDGKALRGNELANYAVRLYKDAEAYRALLKAGPVKDTWLGTGDAMDFTINDDGKIAIANGWHRVQTLVKMFDQRQTFGRVKVNAFEETSVWNKVFAGKNMTGSLKAIMADTPIHMAHFDGTGMTSRGCNRGKSYNTAQMYYSEYAGCNFYEKVREMQGGKPRVIYGESSKSAMVYYVMAMSVMGHLSGTNKDIIDRGHMSFSDSYDAANLALRAMEFWSRYKFLQKRLNDGSVSQKLNLQVWRGVCEVAYRRCKAKGFPGMKTEVNLYGGVDELASVIEGGNKNFMNKVDYTIDARFRMKVAKMVLAELNRCKAKFKKLDALIEASPCDNDYTLGGHTDCNRIPEKWIGYVEGDYGLLSAAGLM